MKRLKKKLVQKVMKTNGLQYHTKLRIRVVASVLPNSIRQLVNWLGGLKLKDRIHVMDIAKEKRDGNTIEAATGMVGLFNSIPSKEIAEHQHQDNQISPIIRYVEEDQKPPGKFTYQIRCKLAHKLAI